MRRKPSAANCVSSLSERAGAAIRDKREPNASVAQCLPAMRTLDRIEKGMR